MSNSGGPLPPCTVMMRAPLVLISVRVKFSNIGLCFVARRNQQGRTRFAARYFRLDLSSPNSLQRALTASMSSTAGQTSGGNRAPSNSGSGS